jgi:hypothetical protein
MAPDPPVAAPDAPEPPAPLVAFEPVPPELAPLAPEPVLPEDAAPLDVPMLAPVELERAVAFVPAVAPVAPPVDAPVFVPVELEPLAPVAPPVAGVVLEPHAIAAVITQASTHARRTPITIIVAYPTSPLEARSDSASRLPACPCRGSVGPTACGGLARRAFRSRRPPFLHDRPQSSSMSRAVSVEGSDFGRGEGGRPMPIGYTRGLREATMRVGHSWPAPEHHPLPTSGRDSARRYSASCGRSRSPTDSSGWATSIRAPAARLLHAARGRVTDFPLSLPQSPRRSEHRLPILRPRLLGHYRMPTLTAYPERS